MKIIVSDFDGSLFVNNEIKCVDKINKYVDDGNIFIIATGRNINNLKKDLDQFNLKCNYYICNDGALIYDQFFNVIYRKDIDNSLVRNIYNMLKDDDNLLEVLIDTGNGYVNDTERAANKIFARYFDRDKAIDTVDKINNRFPSVYGYTGTTSVNITKRTETKGKAIAFLGNYYNLNRHTIYVIGNDINDVSMCNYNFISYGIKTESNKYIDKFEHVVDTFEEAFDEILNDN